MRASGRVVAAGGLLRSLCRDRDGAPPGSPSRNRYSFLGFLRIEATFLSDQPSINFDARPSDELECAKRAHGEEGRWRLVQKPALSRRGNAVTFRCFAVILSPAIFSGGTLSSEEDVVETGVWPAPQRSAFCADQSLLEHVQPILPPETFAFEDVERCPEDTSFQRAPGIGCVFLADTTCRLQQRQTVITGAIRSSQQRIAVGEV